MAIVGSFGAVLELLGFDDEESLRVALENEGIMHVNFSEPEVGIGVLWNGRMEVMDVSEFFYFCLDVLGLDLDGKRTA